MIPQNQNNGRSTGRSNSGRQAPARNYNRSANLFGLENLFGGGGGGDSTQTVTQQNLPDWAIPDAMSTLSMGNYYTQNPDYRPSTLDRDYSGLRGYGPTGRPNSQVGQFGLNPTGYSNPLLADPINNSNTQRQFNQSPNLDNLVAQLPPDMQGRFNSRGSGSSPGVGIADRVGANILEDDAQRQEMLRQREGNGTMQSPQGFRGRPGTGLKFADGWSPTGQDGSSASPTRPDGSIDYSQYGTGLKFADEMPATSGRSAAKYAAPTTGPAATPGGDFNNTAPGGASSGQTSSENQTFNIWDYYDELSGKNKDKNTYPGGGSLSQETIDTINNEVQGVGSGLSFDSSDSFVWGGEGTPKTESTTTSSENQGSNTNTQTNTTAEETPTVDPKDIFNPDDLTPFQAYDRQRFAAPGQNTLRGEGILAGRYDQRFGEGGTDPFAAANQAVGTAANYQSGFQGTMGEGGLGGQAGNYQANLANASDPGVFQSRDYTAGLQNFTNPSAGVGNVNQSLTANQYGSANQGMTSNQYGNTVNLTSGNFDNVVNPSSTTYGNTNAGMTGTDFGNVNQGVTGRSYANENVNLTNVNANLTNPLQGLEPVTFESANQGMTSSTYGNANQGLRGAQDYNRGFQSLLNQSFNPYQDQVVNQTIQDLDRARRISENDIRGQAAKAGAFGSREELLRAENNRNYLDRVAAATGQLRSQGFESAANRASQENLQRLGLTASDVQNVRGLQSQGNLQGQSLTAAADQQLRGLQSQGNLQAQNLTASDRASARDLAGRGALQTQALQSQGGLQAQNLQAQGAQAAQGLTAQSDRQTQALQSQGALAGQQLTAQDAQQVRSLISQGGLQGQNLTAADRQQLNDLVSRGALQSQNLSAADRQQLNSLITQGALQGQSLTASANQQLQGLLSQGNLQGQQLSASDLQNVRNLISQGGLAAQGLQSQGALAALGANADLYSRALGLNSASDLAALQANAGLLSDAMGLDAADLQQRRNLASTEAQFAENALRNAGALNLSGGQALGQLAQAGTADERQRIADILAAGGAGDARNQQDLDFIFNEFNRELAYPGQQIDLRNAAISPATGSIVTTTQPQYQQNPILGGLGAGLAAYGITSNPYLAGAAGLLNYFSDR